MTQTRDWLAPLVLLLAALPAVRAGEVSRARDFGPGDGARELWFDAGGERLSLGVVDPGQGDSLLVPVAFPGASEAWRRGRDNAPVSLVADGRLTGKPVSVPDSFQFDVFLPPDLPAGLRVQARLALKNKDGLWWDGLGRRLAAALPSPPPEGGPDGVSAAAAATETWVRAHALHPGWNTVRVDLSESAGDLRPRGHGMVWSRYALSQIRAIGIVIQGDRPWEGAAAIDNIVTGNASDEFAAPLRLVEFAPPPAAEPVVAGDLAVWSLRLNRPLLNPFRGSEVTVDLLIHVPGRDDPLVLPAYYDIPHRRRRGADGPAPSEAEPDEWRPEGDGRFVAKFRPRAAGTYRWQARASYCSPLTGRAETVASPEGLLEVAPGNMDSDGKALWPGFAQVSKTDPRCFEFENGDFFFPLGHSFRSPADPRYVQLIQRRNWPRDPAPADRDLRAYEDLFPQMRAAGINVCEVWMASWWLDLEWLAAWKNYHGLNGYNLVNAHRLDALLDLAERHGLYLHLVLDNHGKAAAGNPINDPEWPLSPYNSANGGLIGNAEDFFKDARVRALYRDKLRYVAARWSHSPRVFGWELWSELDLTGNHTRNPGHYKSDYVHNWHEEMAAALRRFDQAGRPITTHYSGSHAVADWGLLGKPFIDYASCDAYTDSPGDRLLPMLRATENRALPLGKPFMVTEFGGGAFAASLAKLRAHQYAGLWWGWHSRSAGAPFYWWYELIVRDNYFPAYRAFADYIAGEDKRRGPGDPPLSSRWPHDMLRGAGGRGNLSALLLADGNVFYAWIYDVRHLEDLPDDHGEEEKEITLRLGSAGRGEYAVEVWDCWTGKVVERQTTKPDDQGVLAVALPPFRAQLAVKIKAATPRTRDEILETPRPERLPPPPGK